MWLAWMITLGIVIMAPSVRVDGAECVLDPALPPSLTAHADVQPLCAGFLDPTLPPYSAKANGVTDDTLAVQRAVNDSYTFRMVTRLPPNSVFLVSREITCVQDGRPPAMRSYGYQIVGGSGGAPPIIRLADHSTVASGVLLRFQLIINGADQAPSHYAAGLRAVTIDMGTNPTVSAVSLSGAQLCSIEDVTISGRAFLAGVVGVPGSGGFTSNLRVVGGQIGIWQQSYRPNPSLSGLWLSNQSCCEGCCTGQGPLAHPAAVLLQDSRGPLVLSGFVLEGSGEVPGYAAVRIAPIGYNVPRKVFAGSEGPRIGADRSIALEDGTISVGTGLGISNEVSSNDVSLARVYVRASTVAKCGNTTVTSVPNEWKAIQHWTYTSGSSAVVTNGVEKVTPGKELTIPALDLETGPIVTPPSRNTLLTMHSWDANSVPAWSPLPTAVIDIVRDMGATPSWVNATDDDGPRIQAALARGAATGTPVFVPHGMFHIFDSLVIPGNTSLIGGGRHVATIASSFEHWPNDRLAPLMVINGDNTIVSDLFLQAEVPVFDGIPAASCLLDVRANNTLVRDVRTFRLFNTTDSARNATFLNVAAVSFTGSAGGRFFGLSLDHLDFQTPKGPHLQSSTVGTLISINKTHNALHLYQASVEHLVFSQFQVQIWQSANVFLHAFKFESDPQAKYGHVGDPATGGLLGMHTSTNISIFGGSGNYGVMNTTLSRDILFAWGTTNLEIAALVRKPTLGEAEEAYWIRDVTESNNSSISVTVPCSKLGLLLFRGNFSKIF